VLTAAQALSLRQAAENTRLWTFNPIN